MDKKICPLQQAKNLSSDMVNISEWKPCVEENCAWWYGNSKKCAILERVERLDW